MPAQVQSMPRGALELAGDTLAPCLIEVQTDSHERPLEARLKVRGPYRAQDRELAGSDITTVFGALRVESIPAYTKRVMQNVHAR